MNAAEYNTLFRRLSEFLVANGHDPQLFDLRAHIDETLTLNENKVNIAGILHMNKQRSGARQVKTDYCNTQQELCEVKCSSNACKEFVQHKCSGRIEPCSGRMEDYMPVKKNVGRPPEVSGPKRLMEHLAQTTRRDTGDRGDSQESPEVSGSRRLMEHLAQTTRRDTGSHGISPEYAEYMRRQAQGSTNLGNYGGMIRRRKR